MRMAFKVAVIMLGTSSVAQAQAQVQSGAPAPAPAAPSRVSSHLISRAEALQLAEATLAACKQRNETVAVFVTDADGNLRVAMSADDMNPIGLSTVRLKTAAVLEFREPTRALAARLETDAAFREKYGKDSRYMYHPGALPLYRAGTFVGVLAAGGGHDKDEACTLDAIGQQTALAIHP